jgi:hypothetical protein
MNDAEVVPVASTSRLGLCSTCSIKAALYKCPRCSFPSCSLICSSTHKSNTLCTGIAAPVWERPLLANQLNWGSLMRDQSYISSVSRLAEEMGKELVANGLIPSSHSQRQLEESGSGSRLDELSDKETKLVREARNEGVRLLLLPKGMSRRSKNASRWDQK